jgi:xylulokinase
MLDSLELIREMGVELTQIRVSGGGARNALWRQIQADIYGHDVVTINAAEGPAFGVALLAQVGIGGFASVPEACDATIQVVDSTSFDSGARAVYERGYAIYRQLYRDLKETFRRISDLVAAAS